MNYTADELFESLVDLLDETGWVDVSPTRFVIDISGKEGNVEPKTLEVVDLAAKEAARRKAERWSLADNGDGTHTPVALQKRRSSL